jgi:hypothetical protein
MTVATFLAGFVFAALVETLFADELSTARRVAAVLLTAALGLFVGAVYVYDELGMPEGYWLGGRSGKLRTWNEDRRERSADRRWQGIAEGKIAPSAKVAERLAEVRWITDDGAWRRARADEDAAQLAQDGPMYTSMVRTWRWLFTPAVVFALAGLGVIVADAGTTAAALACLVAVLVGLAWWALSRPPFGND